MIFVILDIDSSTDIATSKVNYFALGNICDQELSQVFQFTTVLSPEDRFFFNETSK